MSIRIVQLGSARQKNEGIRIGTVRRPPRGVSKKNYGKLDFYDVWLPELTSLSLLKAIKESDNNSRTWQRFMLRYKREMELPPGCQDNKAACSSVFKYQLFSWLLLCR